MDWPKCKHKEPFVDHSKKIIVEECRDGILYWGGKRANKNFQPCPKCNGTGERDLTADEADRCLRENNYRYLRTPQGGLLVRRKDGGHTFALDPEDNLIEALNAACRAVRSKG